MDAKISNEATNDLLVAVMERQVKRLFAIIVVLLVLLFVTNIGWIVYEAQFDKIVVTQDGDTDSGGDVNLSGVGKGDIHNYGKRQTDNQNEGS